MITKDQVRHIIDGAFLNEGLFIVDIQVNNKNEITVLVDKENGISIGECTAVSRAIEKNLDREKEDFQLEVSSPGLTSPFKVIEQYRKNIGKNIEILKKDGDKLKGKLVAVSQDEIILEEEKKIKVEGKKKKETINSNIGINIEQVKSAKVVIDFKRGK